MLANRVTMCSKPPKKTFTVVIHKGDGWESIGGRDRTSAIFTSDVGESISITRTTSFPVIFEDIKELEVTVGTTLYGYYVDVLYENKTLFVGSHNGEGNVIRKLNLKSDTVLYINAGRC